jgi:hypothetical protein
VDVTSGTPVLHAINSSFYNDGDDSTDFVGRIGTGVWADLTNGGAVGESAQSSSVSFGTGLDEIEIEWCLEIISGDVINGDTIELQATQSTANFGDGYTESPLITVDKNFRLITTATGVSGITTSNKISWEQEAQQPLASGTMLLVFVGGVDSEKPSVSSVTLSNSPLSPGLETQVLSTAIEATGAGGSSFPSAWVGYLYEPFASGTSLVTGTITVEFDEDVGRMQGMSAIVSGTSGVFDGGAMSISQHTQLPDFGLAAEYLTRGNGSLLVDMCVSESSNHNGHFVGPNQNKFGDVFFSGPKLSTSFKQTGASGTYPVSRFDCGGPFAGVTLVTFALEAE